MKLTFNELISFIALGNLHNVFEKEWIAVCLFPFLYKLYLSLLILQNLYRIVTLLLN
jgi:hypothetical protein